MGTAAAVGTASAKTAAVRTEIAVPVDAANPCLDTVDVVVDHGAFRIALQAHRVVFIQHEALCSVIEAEPGSGLFHVNGLPRHHHILQMMRLHHWIGGPHQYRGIRSPKLPRRGGEQLDRVARIEPRPLHRVLVSVC